MAGEDHSRAAADRAGGEAGAGGACADLSAAAARPALRFAGYAAIFDRPDRSGDIVRRGAFAGQGEAGVPLLWQHRPHAPIGRIERLAEDAHGLRVIARVTRATQAGREAAALLGEGAVGGLSFGYRVGGSRRLGKYRELTRLELIEVSLVTFPMQPLARVHGLAEEELQ